MNFPNGKRHPRAAFGLYAVATCFPRKLARRYRLQATDWEGVYELPWSAHQVRLIVLNGIAKHPRNAPWELFSSEQDRMRQGLIHYRARVVPRICCCRVNDAISVTGS